MNAHTYTPPGEENQLTGLKAIESPDRGVLCLDSGAVIRSANNRVAEVFGMAVHEIVGSPYKDFVEKVTGRFSDPESFRTRSLNLIAQGSIIGEDVFETSDGSTVLHRYSTPLTGVDGKPDGRLEIYSDITFRRRLEREVVERNRELARLNEDLRAAQEQLVQSEKLRVLGEMAAGVAHDLNNVLGAVIANVQLLMRKKESAPLHEELKCIELAAHDGAETVRRIKELAKVGVEQALVPVDLAEIANDILRVMQPTWQASGDSPEIEINTCLESTKGVLGNPPELREALANILLNAVQAMPEGGVITISTGTAGNNAFLSVADNGVGMSEDTKRRLFDPFFTTRGAEGTGLGMSIVYAIISRHGGHIEIESKERAGTTITITLPASPHVVKLPQAAGLVKTEPKSARVMVVDDEEVFRAVIAEMLIEAGHKAVMVSNLDEASVKCAIEDFDVILVDDDMLDHTTGELQMTGTVIPLRGARAGNSVDSKSDMSLNKPVKMETLLEVLDRAMRLRDGGSRGER